MRDYSSKEQATTRQPASALEFHPFFDPRLGDAPLGMGARFAISVVLGAAYSLFQYLSLTAKQSYFEHFSWVLSLILCSSMLALYIATQAFRHSLVALGAFDSNRRISKAVVANYLANSRLIAAGLCWGLLTVLVANVFGIPLPLQTELAALVVLNLGYFLSGFISGMGLFAVIAVIILHLKIAPLLPHGLNPDNPDGRGGFKSVGDTLWYFAGLVILVALLVSFYLLRLEWTNMQSTAVRSLFLLWLSLPYLFAISVVMIPGLVVRRQVQEYKYFSLRRLKKEEHRLFSSFKQFEPDDDDSIIASKKELNRKLDEVQQRMTRLKTMRASPLDGKQEE